MSKSDDGSSPAYSGSNDEGNNQKSRNSGGSRARSITSIWRKNSDNITVQPGDGGVNKLSRIGLTIAPSESEEHQRPSTLDEPEAALNGRGVLHFLVSRLWRRDQEPLLFPQGSESTQGSTTTFGASTAAPKEHAFKSIYLTNLDPSDYEQHLKLGLTLRFVHSNDEMKFSDKLRGSYRYIAPMIGTFYTLFTVVMNVLVGVIVIREQSARLFGAWIGNMIINLALCLYLIKFGRASFEWTTRKAELTCLICLLINPVIISITSVVYRARVAEDYESDTIMISTYTRNVDFWILEWSSTCISLAFIDLWQTSRTKIVIYAHILLSALVIFCRVYWLQTIPEIHDEFSPFGAPKHKLELWIACLQSCVLLSVVWQMYCSRYLEELRERLLFIANRCNLAILGRMRDAEKTERKYMELRAAGLSLSERITQPLKRAMLEILTLAFKEEESGDIYLLELNEQLRSCVSLVSANAEQLFQISHTARSPPEKRDASSSTDREPATNTIAGNIILNGADEENQFLGDRLGHGGPPSQESITSPNYLHNVGKELDIGCIKLFQERKNFLLETAFHLMKDMGSTGAVPEQTIVRYIFLVQQRHWNNPYHNRGHVAMVVHMSKLFCDAFNLPKDDLLAFSSLLAALGHDVAHGGRNSHFIVTDGIERNNNLLVDLCGTSNVVEGLHAHLTFRLAQVEGCNIFHKLTEAQYRLVRRFVIDLILATNMASHFEILGALRLRHQSGAADWLYNIEDQLLLRKILLKAADLAHACVPWTEHFEWSTRITNEFYQQGELETALKYTISPLCDRKGVNEWANSQSSYVTEVVMPLFTQLNLLPHQKVFADALLIVSINQEQWKKPQTFRQLNEQIAPYKYEDALLYASLLAPATLLDKEPQNAPAFIASQGLTRNSNLPVANINKSNAVYESDSDAGEEQESSDESDGDNRSDTEGHDSDSVSYSDNEDSSESSSALPPENSRSTEL